MFAKLSKLCTCCNKCDFGQLSWGKCLYFIYKKSLNKVFQKWNQLVFLCKAYPIYMYAEGLY